jgi:hypothetical protein
MTFAVAVACANAEITPTLSIERLTESSDLIIAGKIERVRETGSGLILLNGTEYARRDFQADIQVGETLKGTSAPTRFTFTYSTPGADEVGSVAERNLVADAYRVVFLKKTASGFVFASPYYPSIAAASKSCGAGWRVHLGDDAYRRVLQRLLELLCTDSTDGEKRSALFALDWDQDSAAAPFLKAVLGLPNVRTDPTLRMAIVSYLLHWRDLNVLPLAEQDLFDQSVQTSTFPKSNLVQAISSLEPKISIPILARVLKSPEPEDRVAAARFLEYTNSQNALSVLLSDLDDPNHEVQFAVMQSLGNLTNQYQWRPNTVDPDSQWNACVQHWREFAGRLNTGAPIGPERRCYRPSGFKSVSVSQTHWSFAKCRAR